MESKEHVFMSPSRQQREDITIEELRAENERLTQKLSELEETVRAIQDGTVDAFVLGQESDQRIYTLAGADRPYRLFVEGMQQGAATLYVDRTIAFSNQQLADLLKVPYSRMVGVALDDFVADESRSTYETLLSTGQIGSGHGEVILKRSDGSRVPVFLTSNALPADCGAQIGVLFTDLTMEKFHQELAAIHEAVRKNQAELKRSRDQLAVLLETAAMGLHHVSADGTILWVNQAELDLLGYDREEYIGHHIAEFHVDQKVIGDILDRLCRGERLHDVEARMKCRDGSMKTVVIDSSALWEDGKFIHSQCFTRDITERKQMEDALSEKERQLHHISDNTAVIIAQCSRDLRYTFVNRACADFLGQPVEQIVGRPISEVMGKEAFEAVRPYIERVLAGEQLEYEAEVPYARIGVRHMRVSYVPDFDPSGNVCGWIAGITDITDRKRTEEALRNSEARLSTFLEQLPIGVGAMDLAGRWTISNAVMRTFVQDVIPSLDPKSTSRWQAFDSQGQPLPSQDWPGARALRGETVSQGIEMLHTTDEGSSIWTRVSAAPLRNQHGEVIGALSVVQDIDAIKRAELAARESADRFRSLVAVITDVPWTADADGNFSSPQPAWAWYTGQTWEEYRGLGWIEALHPDDREELKKSWVQACASRSAYISAHGRVWHEPTRQYRYFEAQATPVFHTDGTIREWVGAYTDINARKQLERQLEERATELALALEERKKLDEERERLLESERHARTEAERSTRLKEEFLSTVSHELRTPLNAILGWTQLMQQSSDETMRKQGLDAIERGARGQAMLIDELLDVSRIVSGKLRLEVAMLEVGPLVEAAVETLRPAAEAKSIQVIQTLAVGTGPVNGDPSRLQQTVWNLLSNAIKFTPKGGTVQIGVARVSGSVEITVRDTGAGIPASFLPYVFDRFRQADNSTTRAHSGLGLGLAIVKHLVELHGGTVEVESEGEGKGAMFTVRLPVAVTAPRHLDTVVADSGETRLSNVKVLVVDDDPNSCEIVRRILAGREALVSTAQSADDALKLIEELCPDVLISDIGMPIKDGLTLIREVRSNEMSIRAPRLPAVALTAFARPEDRIRVLQAGYNTHVSKPVNPHELIAVVSSLAAGKPDLGQ